LESVEEKAASEGKVEKGRKMSLEGKREKRGRGEVS